MGKFLEWVNVHLGVDLAVIAVKGVYIVLTVLAAWLAHAAAKKFLLRTLERFIRKTKTGWDDILLERKVFDRLCDFAPAMVVYIAAPMIFSAGSVFIIMAHRVVTAYMILVGALVANSFLSAVIDIYNTFDLSRKMPIRGLVQVVKIVMYFVAGITIISILIDKNPGLLFGGLGAMTAVLMLVFKDAILGFVAGIHLSTNKMVHIGDWIEMPKYGADGDVIDISLTTVKVQNWDKTISTIPAYALISDSFKNWRGMAESGGRRIKRAIYIDMNSIKICSEKMLEKFKKFHHLGEYIEQKTKELADYNARFDCSELINGRRLTNVGTFRAYVCEYLRSHPKISKNMTFLVRHLEPGAHGLPIEIYVFCNDTKWANYEGVQADIFDHILAVVPEFELRVFQNPTGGDFANLNGGK